MTLWQLTNHSTHTLTVELDSANSFSPVHLEATLNGARTATASGWLTLSKPAKQMLDTITGEYRRHLTRRALILAESKEMDKMFTADSTTNIQWAVSDPNGDRDQHDHDAQELVKAAASTRREPGFNAEEVLTQVVVLTYIDATHHWVGYDALGKPVTLEDKHCKENFDHEWLASVRDSPNKKFRVPVGNKRGEGAPALNGLPHITLRQTRADCVFLSLANALHYFGDFNYGLISTMASPSLVAIKEQHDKGNTLYTAFDYLRDNINHALPKYPLIGIRGRGFDPHSLSGHEIAVCVLLASDGAQNHCVTIMHNMIFDACEVHALPLTQESLDICVRAHSEDCERCVAVAQALLLSPSKKIVAALRRKPHDWRC